MINPYYHSEQLFRRHRELSGQIVTVLICCPRHLLVENVDMRIDLWLLLVKTDNTSNI